MSHTLTIIRRVLDSEAGRRTPVRVVARLVVWQLWRRALRSPMTFRTVTGSRLRLLPGASDSLSGFWYQQLPDFEELAFALHVLRPGDLFVDVGANQGGWSLVAAGHGARVIAFEPVPLTRERLLANLASNPAEVASRVTVQPVGLSDGDGTVEFTADLDAGNHRLRSAGSAGTPTVRVELARADERLRGLDPTLMKIDVEGEELGVLRGARDILSRPSLQAVIMETFRPSNHDNPDLVSCERVLASHGFLPMAYDPRTRDLDPLRAPADGSQNTIYVRDPGALAARLRAAPAVCALGGRI